MAQTTAVPEPTAKRFECAICQPPRGFDTADELHEHLMSTHADKFPQTTGPIICPVCGRYDFKSVDALRGHSRIHKKKEEREDEDRSPKQSAASSDSEVFAAVRLRGPEALHDPLRTRLASLLDALPDVPTKSTQFVLDEWDSNPAVRLDFRGIEHLLATAGIRSDKVVYISSQLVALYNHYADALSREGYRIDTGQQVGQGVPPPAFGPAAWPQTGPSGSMAWTPNGWQPRQGYGYPSGPEDVASAVRRELDRRTEPAEQTIELETTDPSGKPVRVKGSMTQIAALRSAGIIAAEGAGQQVDIEGAIKAATEPLQQHIASLQEKLDEKEKGLEKLEANKKEDLRDAKEEFEKEEGELKEEIRDLKKDLKDMVAERDRYRDDALRKELAKDNAERTAAVREEDLKEAKGELREATSKLGSAGYSSDGMKAMSEVGNKALEIAEKKQPFERLLSLGERVLLGTGQPPQTPPASSQLTELAELEKRGLVAKN